jgi:hypothetical protein
VLGHEVDVRLEDRFKSCEGGRSTFCGLVYSSQQAFRNPGHHRLQDCVFSREVTEQCSLGQPHALRDGRGRDVAGVLFGSQVDHCLDGGRAPLISR